MLGSQFSASCVLLLVYACMLCVTVDEDMQRVRAEMFIYRYTYTCTYKDMLHASYVSCRYTFSVQCAVLVPRMRIQNLKCRCAVGMCYIKRTPGLALSLIKNHDAPEFQRECTILLIF